jgi:hypothetical protein
VKLGCEIEMKPENLPRWALPNFTVDIRQSLNLIILMITNNLKSRV